MEIPDFLSRDAYGEIILAGHRVCLHHIVQHYRNGASPEAIAIEYPTVSLATIHKVIAYYLENQAQLDDYVHEVQAEIARQAATPPHGPTLQELRRRITARMPAKSA